MSLINKMNVGNTNYDIQDRLMPDAIGQAGQVLKVKDDGSGLEFSTIESGCRKLYRHDVKISNITEGSDKYFQISFLSTSGTPTTDINQFVTGNGFLPIVSLVSYIQLVLPGDPPDPFPLAQLYGYFKGVIYKNGTFSYYSNYYMSMSVSMAGQGYPANMTHVDTVTEL